MASERIPDFDTWKPGYGGASVRVLRAGTTDLAIIYADPALTVTLSNPQTLLTFDQDGIQYGKWAQPIYIDIAVQLQIDGVDKTGIIRPPLLTLNGVDASKATVKRANGTQVVELEDVVARTIHAADFGVLEDGGSGSAATNTATITAAIGVAAAQGGGTVLLPAGSYNYTVLTVPQAVVVEGAGRGSTSLLSTTADDTVTFSGERAGLRRLTLDGVARVVGSNGIAAANIAEARLEDVLVKNFETGLHFHGGSRAAFYDLYIDNCANGAIFHGHVSDSGAAFRDNEWRGGLVTNCTTAGVLLENEDLQVESNRFADIGFENNTGIAVQIIGAQLTALQGCWFSGNTTDLDVADGTPEDDDNVIEGLRVQDCRFQGGAIALADTLLDVIFDNCILNDVDVTIATPGHPVLVRDCREDALVTIAGDSTKWMRWRSTEHGTVIGVTTGNAATKAWAVTLEPGQRAFLIATVIGKAQNLANTTGEYLVAVSAERPDSQLAYDTQTANFTPGQIITGGTSGATALITGDTDGGATGTLTVRQITGEFQDNEIITDPLGGSATVNGALVPQNCALLGSNTDLRTPREDDADWAVAFAANGPEVECRVTGDVDQTVQWMVKVDALLDIP